MGRDILADLEDSDDVSGTGSTSTTSAGTESGYPERPLPAKKSSSLGRILVLAEVYDALIEERSYKPAWPIPKIAGFFRDQAGKHFDPDLAALVADGLEARGSRDSSSTASSAHRAVLELIRPRTAARVTTSATPVGEVIVVPTDPSAGSIQTYESRTASVCCRPNVLTVQIDDQGLASGSTH